MSSIMYVYLVRDYDMYWNCVVSSP